MIFKLLDHLPGLCKELNLISFSQIIPKKLNKVLDIQGNKKLISHLSLIKQKKLNNHNQQKIIKNPPYSPVLINLKKK